MLLTKHSGASLIKFTTGVRCVVVPVLMMGQSIVQFTATMKRQSFLIYFYFNSRQYLKEL